jgi:hypothetical protein
VCQASPVGDIIGDYDRNRGNGVDNRAIAGNHTSRGKAPRVGRPRADPRTYDRNCVSDLGLASRVRRKTRVAVHMPGYQSVAKAGFRSAERWRM